MGDLKAKLKNDKSKSIAILAYTNEEVYEIYKDLKEYGFDNVMFKKNKDDNGGKKSFSIRKLDEIRSFIDKLRDGIEFDEAKKATEKEYDEGSIAYKVKECDNIPKVRKLPRSTNYDLMLKIIDKFEKEYKGKSDFEKYIKNVEIKDFKQTILVSTMHKSKGDGFDSVYVVAKKDHINDEYLKRTLYVAITRAKMHLCIYDEAENLNDEEMKKCFEESDTYQLSTEQNDSFIDKISITMDYWDVLSSNFKDMDFYSNIEKIKPRAGEYAYIECRPSEGYRMSIEDKDISGLTRCGRNIIEKFEKKGYSITNRAKILYVIRDDEREVDDPKNVYRIIWQITLEKKTD